ncbi:hypothetical protein Tco_0178269 [Tanacetum coccineum]
MASELRVHEDEIPKTAFRMRYGRYEFTAMPFWVDQCTSDFHRRNESGARVAIEDEFGAAEEREVSCKAQQGQSGVNRKLFGSCRNNMSNEPILALPEGSDNFVVMRGARVKMLSYTKREGDVRTLIMEEAHATKYSVRPGVNEAVARHGVHMSSIPDKDGMYIEVLERDVEVVRNTMGVGILTFREVSFPTKIVIIRVFEVFSLEVLYGRRGRKGLRKPKIVKRVKLIVEMKLLGFSVGDHVMMKVSPWKGVVRFDKKGELAPRYIGPFDILERIGPVAYRLRLPDELSIGSYLSGVKNFE